MGKKIARRDRKTTKSRLNRGECILPPNSVKIQVRTSIEPRRKSRMHLKTILNRVQNFKSFVYGPVRWVEDASEPTIEAELRPRANAGHLLGLRPPRTRL